jgi:hypothetical protein
MFRKRSRKVLRITIWMYKFNNLLNTVIQAGKAWIRMISSKNPFRKEPASNLIKVFKG